ncbi:hypothetical protein [Halocynthiibacter namhaensis]|uniref:hypothetical protein n=1 Tax=Halocynthiibacter namhaensis TaxID=1290553 RepID=UPI00068AD06B|nr:hypothetical protein [Halocynthiibacter namhaensis]
MRFAFIDAWKEEWPVEFLCKVMRVTSRGFRAWRARPMSQRQRDDMVILAHIREQHRLSLQSYGRPRMTTLEDAWQAFDLVDRAHKASAAAITLRCDPGQQDRATLSGMPLNEGMGVQMGQAGTDMAMASCGQRNHTTAQAYQGDALSMAQRIKGQAELQKVANQGGPELFEFK